MINAELNHNPYLLLTTVKFNGHEPRINSQIEKYEHQPLKDWVHKVPDIFYNEMNGYDFDLNFVGTVPDYEEVQKAFSLAGISQEEVRIFHKNELEDANTKSNEIDQIIEWLREHPNRKFDFASFWEKNSELFESTYPYIIIRGEVPKETMPDVGIEVVEKAQELSNTVLSSTPILFYIDGKSAKQFRQDFQYILSRHDIRNEQLFFMIHPQLDINQVSRVISDLGVKNPQVIKQYNEAIVLEYFQNYPVTEYVRETIKVFESVVETIENLLEKENRESEIANAGIYAEIDTLGSEIMLLKQTDGYFVERDNYGLPQSFIKIRQNFEEQIKKWKNRKTKVTGDTEADIAAEEYNGYLKKYMNDFNDSILTSFQVAGEAIKTKYRDMYLNAGIDTEFVPTGITLCEVANEPFPEMKAELLSLKEITYVEQKNDFFSMFRKTTEENPEPVRVATCYYEQWRMKALELIMPLAEKVINSSVEALRTYYNELAEEYHLHLGKLISEKTEEKERVSSQLSDDERKLQEDNDWLAALKEQLLHLERG